MENNTHGESVESGCSSTEDLTRINVDEIVSKVDHLISTLADNHHGDHENNSESTIIEIYAKLVRPEMESYVSGSTKIGQDSYKDEVLIESVSRISKLTSLLGTDHETNSVFQHTMTLMEDELRNILEEYTTDESSKEDDFPGVPEGMISRMRVIARVMGSAGYEAECSQVFTLLRRTAFMAAMKRHGFQKLSAEQIHKMTWEQLADSHIPKWTKAVKHTSAVLLPKEQELCNDVFSDYPSVSRGIMTNLARSIVILFLNFVEETASSTTLTTTETLFKILEIHDALTELIAAMPHSDEEATRELKSEIGSVQHKLGDAVISIFDNLENSIKHDVAKNPVPCGAVHPLTRYTMNYLRYACDFKDTLEHVLKDHHKKLDADAHFSEEEDDDDEDEQRQTRSRLRDRLVRIMELLDANLDDKSRLYKDPSLRYIFLMNNGRYMLQKIKESTEMRELVGGISSRKRSSELRAYHKNYQRETWSKVLQCINHEGIQVNGKVNKTLLKERLKNFNQLFDEIHRTQSTWIVSDEQLQSELRVSISAVMIPAYRSFLARFRQHLPQGKQMERYVKFQPEDIETTIDKLFDGNHGSISRRR